jgi:hypothetical protein
MADAGERNTTTMETGDEPAAVNGKWRGPGRLTMVLPALLVLLVVLVGLLYRGAAPGPERMVCALPGVVGPPVADTPEQAFAASYSQESGDGASGAPGGPAMSDFRRTGQLTWVRKERIDAFTQRGTYVEVEAVPGGYVVKEALPCDWIRD